MKSDLYLLERFVAAQSGVYEQALAELRAGAKRSHWMWFVFPQLAGLGTSAMAARYAIASLDEAAAYLQHPLLGPRLRACTQAVMDVDERTAEQIFGIPDVWKFRSSLTLFHLAAREELLFSAALTRYFLGEYDPATIERLPGSVMGRASSRYS